MFKKLSEVWNDLNRTIYTGKRLQENLHALTVVSLFTACLGLVLIVMDFAIQKYSMLIPSLATFLGGVSCAYLAGIKKDREKAILVPTAFCIIAFTFYAITGAGEGTAILWSLLLPIGISYFVSVKYGIYLSLYYTLIYVILFYSPLRKNMAEYYSMAFIIRFPLIYGSLAAFTTIAMVQYHRSILLENEYTDRLNAEVAKQTAVAEERSRKIEQMSFRTIQSLAHAIDAKDPYTKGHSTRVSRFSVLIAEALGWEPERINDLRYAAMLHDIGKIGVPDSILNKPTSLTEIEYDIIKSHAVMGADILRDRITFGKAEEVALSHHERYDGRGYPHGMKGKEICEEARIIAIADAYDAMTSDRIYRKALTPEQIREELMNEKGKQFDPEYVDIFLGLWDRGLLEDGPEDEPAGDDENVEASSALLREVMEAFLTQNAAENIDHTSGIMNRIAGEAAVARRMQEVDGCFVFLDVDNLKTINDIHGHSAGDKVLRLMGNTLKENSQNGICCRLGGDEFILFLEGVSAEEADARIRKIIRDFEAGKNDDIELSPATISAGAVMTTADEPYSKAYNKADKALYHVKQNGKNGFNFYNSDSEFDRNSGIDINKLVSGIKSSGTYEGALDVEYRQFARLYDFIENMEKRYGQPFELILITFDAAGNVEPQIEELEKAMFFMERSIRGTIRNVDVLTRCGRQQFLVILVGTDPEGVKTAVDRIFRGYYKMNGSSAYTPSYSLAEDRRASADRSLTVQENDL